MPVLNSSNVFVLDNGGGQLKAGYSNMSAPRLIPNCITKAKSEKRRAFVGDQMDDCRDLSGLYYMLPFQKGYLVNWDHQKTVWDYMFGKDCFKVDISKISMVFTEPYFNFTSVKEGLSEMFFEEYGIGRLFHTNPGDLSCYKNKTEFPDEQCCLVVDSGYSFTHIVPYIRGRRVKEAVKRIDIGGKLLTNHLKEIISYRQIHVLDETYVMNACKEDSCFVSLNYTNDMKLSQKEALINPRRAHEHNFKIARDYVLPDFTTIRRGFLKPASETGKKSSDNEESNEQTIRLNNERFSVPELLFSPSDVGVQQAGIPETIVESILQCEPDSHPWLFRNVVLTGGNACIPNMRERVEREVRALAPDAYDVSRGFLNFIIFFAHRTFSQFSKVNVRLPDDPTGYAWHGGCAISNDTVFKEISVTKDEYMENGPAICQERFYL